MTYSSNTHAIAADLIGKAGLTLTEAGQTFIFDTIQREAVVVPGQPVTIDGMPAADWIADLPTRAPDLIASTGGKTSPRETGNLTDRMRAQIAASRAADRKTAEERVEEIVATHGNPWRASAQNMTRQMQITRISPDLAVALKAEAAR